MSTLKPGRTSGIKKRMGSRSNSKVNILYAARISLQRRMLLRERRPSRRICSAYGRWQKPITRLVANRWICSKQSTRFGEPACVAYLRWSLIIISIFLALQWIESGKELSVRSTRFLRRFATCMGHYNFLTQG